MTNTWFITGTDTGAGKTCVGRALLLAARARGLRALGYKPIESGAGAAADFGEDALALAQACGESPQSTFVFEAPIAPLLAAEAQGKTVSLAQIRTRTTELEARAELLVIEGAGGLLVPLTPNETIADLALALDRPILIVAADRLGSINHSLLTIEAARSRGLRIAAVILSEGQKGEGQGLNNQEQIYERSQVPVLRLPFAQGGEALAEVGEPLLASLLANAKSGKELV